MWTKILFAFYTVGIHLGNLYIFLGSFFSGKLKLLYEGRKKALNILSRTSSLQNPIWIHCASLGEFEQGRPLIEALRRHYPQCHIWLTFYSPSGYTVRHRYELADWVGYLPLDTATNARQLIDALRPTAVELKEDEELYGYARTYIKQFPKNPEILWLYSQTQITLGKRREAIETLIKLKNLTPYNQEIIDLIQKLVTEEELAGNFGNA